MISGKIISLIIKITDSIKPYLIKLLPIRLLRLIKRAMVSSAMERLGESSFLPFERSAFADGVNLIGFIRGEIGLGQSCRLVAAGLEASGIDFTVYNYEQTSAMRFNDHTWEHKIIDTTPYNINLIHINPYELPLAYLQLGSDVWNRRYNIAFWLWELEEFPAEWENSIKLADEIWTPSEFASSSIRAVTNKPVHTVPYPISAEVDDQITRETFSLPPETFLFLCMYDCNSTMERKNPMGAIRAYKQAFSREEPGMGLVVKVNNPQQRDLDILRGELEGYSNIYIISDIMDKPKVNALIACVDVYISLHRSEGFGLVPAEAMFLGTPVIATNWSSNTEFMNSDVSCMVDYEFVTIQKDIGPYKKGNRWADPDIAQAAKYMKKLYSEPEYHQQLAKDAKAHIGNILSAERCAGLMRRRIAEIYEGTQI